MFARILSLVVAAVLLPLVAGAGESRPAVIVVDEAAQDGDSLSSRQDQGRPAIFMLGDGPGKLDPATGVALATTGVPVAIGLAMTAAGDREALWLVFGGALVGPAVGYAVAGDDTGVAVGLLGRLAIPAAAAFTVALVMGKKNGGGDHALAEAAIVGGVVACGVAVALAAVDISHLRSRKVTSEPRALRVVPQDVAGALGLAIHARF